MTNYEQLKADIAAVVRANGIEAITGDRLQQVLTHMVDVLGNDYALAGVATPTTNPPTPDGNTAYIAGTSGTYTYFLDSNYNPLVVPSNCLTALLMYDASAEAWTAYPFGTIAQGTIGTNELADGAVTTPKIADSAVTSAKIGANAVTSAKINNGAVSEQKLATAVQNKINDAVTLSTSQTITGGKEFTQPVALNAGANSDNDLDLEAADNVNIRANGGTMELSADDDMNISAHRLDINNPTGIDGDLSVIGDVHASGDVDASGDIKATGKVYANINDELATKSYTDTQLATKQNTIADLDTIRSGAALGATAYQKPSGGIPESDLSASVQASLGKAETALQTETDPVFSASPAAGITAEDISAWNAKQDALTFDNVPTENSDNPVKSGGVKKSFDDLIFGATIPQSGTTGYYINTPAVGSTVTLTETQSGSYSSFKHYIQQCQEGDLIIVNGQGISSGRLWCFCNSSNVVLKRSESSAEIGNNLILVAPASSSYVIINDRTGNGQQYYANENCIRVINTKISSILAKEPDFMRAENAVTPKDCDFFTHSTNLYNKDAAGCVNNKYVYYVNGNLMDSTLQKVSDYIRVTPLEKYISNFSGQAAFYDIDKNFISGVASANIAFQAPANAYYLRVSYRMDSDDTNQLNQGDTLLTYQPYYDALKPYIEVPTDEQLNGLLGEEAGVATEDTLTNGESVELSTFPSKIKKNLCISFYARITSFSAIYIGQGYSNSSGAYIEVNSTNVSLLYGNTRIDAAHGLTISDFIKVHLYVTDGQKLYVILNSIDGVFTHTFNFYYAHTGVIFARSNGSSLTDVKLSATSADFRKSVWAFGDSYFGLSSVRWPYYLRDYGFFELLLCGLAGDNSANEYTQLLQCLNFGTPKYVVWCLGMNDISDANASTPNPAWLSVTQSLISLCLSKNITPILSTIPCVPDRNHEGKNAWVKGSGYRYIDFAQAVHGETYTAGVDNWYAGYLEHGTPLNPDNVHPTALGAKALATQFLADFPEIMQYGISEEPNV